MINTQSLDKVIERIRFFEAKYGSPSSQRIYSIGYWLKKYLQIPQFIPLLVHMGHGVEMKFSPYKSYFNKDFPIFVTNKRDKRILADKYKIKSYISGTPFLYCRRINNITRDSNACGTLFFPSHSTHFVNLKFNWQDYADSLLRLPKRFYPLTVCLYWKELLEGAYKPFVKRNISVTSAGHAADPQFALNFYNLLKRCKYTSSNSFGSYIFYSLEMGIPFFLHGNTPRYYNVGKDKNVPQGYFTDEYFFPDYSNAKKQFTYDLSGPIVITESQREMTRVILGLDAEVDKNQLRRIILASFIQNGPKLLLNEFHKVFLNISQIGKTTLRSFVKKQIVMN